MPLHINYSRFFNREFKRLHKKYPSLPGDIKQLILSIEEQPNAGVEIINEVRKIRLRITSKGKGKSGGGRVLYLYVERPEDMDVLNLLYLYDKSEIENVSDALIKEILEESDL
jgi:mRNA-degrading endonuclease RelE of RelBE toxin-antitoxin system